MSPEEVTRKPIESNTESRRRVATDSETSRKHGRVIGVKDYLKMSEGSLKKKLLPAWAPLILVPPTGRGTRPSLSLAPRRQTHLLSTSLSFPPCLTVLVPPHEFTSISILIPSSVTLVRNVRIASPRERRIWAPSKGFLFPSGF